MRRLNQNQNGFGAIEIILIIVVAATLGLGSWYILHRSLNGGKQKTSLQSSDKYAIFEGVITHRNDGCAHDDICSITIDGRDIITGGGLTNNPQANVYGSVYSDLRSGDHVSVKALNTDFGLTLQGCSECYVKRAK